VRTDVKDGVTRVTPSPPYKGISTTFNSARGTDAVNHTTARGVSNENERDTTFDRRIEKGPLRGMWVRVRDAYVRFRSGGGQTNNVRRIINDPLSLL
jgi:hypothetical protein